jgi:hypothetical protein
MKKYIYLSVCGLIFLAYTQTVNAKYFNMRTDTTTDNQLTQNETQQGWKLLFDGNSLNGWRTYKNEPGSWNVQGGMLCSERSGDNQHADLITNDMFENFEFSIDWKISPKGNSGIMYLVTEQFDNTYQSGPEYQLIDDDGFTGQIEEYQKTSANYAMQAPTVKAVNPPGTWNTTKIVVNKGHVEHWLNGKKVVEYELWSDEWKKQKAAGKWKDEAGYGASKTGHIALQSAHSNIDKTDICFKNIKIKLL